MFSEVDSLHKPTYLPINLVSRLQVPSDINAPILLDPFLFSVTGKTLKRVEVLA